MGRLMYESVGLRDYNLLLGWVHRLLARPIDGQLRHRCPVHAARPARPLLSGIGATLVRRRPIRDRPDDHRNVPPLHRGPGHHGGRGAADCQRPERDEFRPARRPASRARRRIPARDGFPRAVRGRAVDLGRPHIPADRLPGRTLFDVAGNSDRGLRRLHRRQNRSAAHAPRRCRPDGAALLPHPDHRGDLRPQYQQSYPGYLDHHLARNGPFAARRGAGAAASRLRARPPASRGPDRCASCSAKSCRTASTR